MRSRQQNDVMQIFQEIQQDISNRRQRELPAVENNRQQTTPQAAAAGRGQQVAPGYYGPQPGQRAAVVTAGQRAAVVTAGALRSVQGVCK